jgi:hypothetical protein
VSSSSSENPIQTKTRFASTNEKDIQGKKRIRISWIETVSPEYSSLVFFSLASKKKRTTESESKSKSKRECEEKRYFACQSCLSVFGSCVVVVFLLI